MGKCCCRGVGTTGRGVRGVGTTSRGVWAVPSCAVLGVLGADTGPRTLAVCPSSHAVVGTIEREKDPSSFRLSASLGVPPTKCFGGLTTCDLGAKATVCAEDSWPSVAEPSVDIDTDSAFRRRSPSRGIVGG